MRFISFLSSLLLSAAALILLLFATANTAETSVLLAQSSTPTLSIASGITATAGTTITVPIHFRRAGFGVAGVAFSLDIDPTCLRYVDKRFALPAQQVGSLSFDGSDTDGEIDIVVADYSPPFAVIPDTDGLVKLFFETVCTPAPGNVITTPILFSASPAASFSNGQGQSLAGGTANGFVEIVYGITPPTPDPTPDPTPTEIVTPSLSIQKFASQPHAKLGDKIEYTYQLSNTGNVSITVSAIDDKLGTVAFLALPGGTAQLPGSHLIPGQAAVGFRSYRVRRCDPQGDLVNSVEVTGITSQGITATAQATASVFISNPVLPPLRAEENTIYLGCAIRLVILPAAQQPESFQVVVIAGPAPTNLILDGVQEKYPYGGLHDVADKTKELLLEGCESPIPCNIVNRITFYNNYGYWTEIVDQIEVIRDLYLPIVARYCDEQGIAC